LTTIVIFTLGTTPYTSRSLEVLLTEIAVHRVKPIFLIRRFEHYLTGMIFLAEMLLLLSDL
jgi:hypothetical protein